LDLLSGFSVVKVDSKDLATLKESFYTTRTFPIRTDIEHKGTPGLTTGDESGQGLWCYLIDRRAEAGANDPNLGHRIAELINLRAILEL
jgi:hypothetical protein